MPHDKNHEGNFKEVGGGKQMKNRVGGKFQLWLVPFQRQCLKWISSMAASQFKRALEPHASRGVLLAQPPLLTSCGLPSHPWAPESCPTGARQQGSPPGTGAKQPALPAWQSRQEPAAAALVLARPRLSQNRVSPSRGNPWHAQ